MCSRIAVPLIAVFVFCIHSGSTDSNFTIPIDEGYYWRDFTGEIPPDAIAGGLTKEGTTTYIGQTLSPQYPNLVPGDIRRDTKILYYEMGGYQETKLNVKILCTQHPQNFHWVKTTLEGMTKLDRDLFIPGGYEKFLFFIGRVDTEGAKVVGKLNRDDPDKVYHGVWLAHNKNSGKYDTDFEVLLYNPNARRKDEVPTKAININIIN